MSGNSVDNSVVGNSAVQVPSLETTVGASPHPPVATEMHEVMVRCPLRPAKLGGDFLVQSIAQPHEEAMHGSSPVTLERPPSLAYVTRLVGSVRHFLQELEGSCAQGAPDSEANR